MRPIAFLVLLAAVSWRPPASLAAEDPRAEVLRQLQQIAANSGGELGVSALGLKSEERIQLNASDRYPMASVVKVAVALKLLDEVDRGRISLKNMVDIAGGDLSPGSGEILKDMDPGEARMGSTVGQLLEVMMTRSDNTATDHLLTLVGGPKSVTKHLRGLGIDGIDISRPTALLVADSWGFKLPPPGERTRQHLKAALNSTPRAAREQAARHFLEDPRDTATPDAMVAILDLLATGKALSKESTELLLATMARCKTGAKRLQGQLPPRLPVAHKTGTLTGVATNDVGILTLPWGQGPLIVAVFVKGSSAPLATQEASIAAASVALYRYYNR